MSQQLVTVSKDNGVATVTLNRPEKLNTLNEELLAGVEAAIECARRRAEDYFAPR